MKKKLKARNKNTYWYKYSHTEEYRKYNNQRQTERQHKLKQLGLCAICGNKPLFNKTCCETCRIKLNIARKKYRKRKLALTH